MTATARDNSGQTTSATMSVTVNPAGNQTPTVAITSPANGASYTAPASMNIQASASDPDGTIARVEFYRGSTLIATDTTSPFTASWTSAPAGNYALTARAYDNRGASVTSGAVNISIGSAANQPPTVSITSPTAGASFTAPASIAIAATAADADGTVASVDFYAGTQLIGTDSSSPYTLSWTNVPAGNYSLTAVARDNAGGSRTSTAVAVGVGSTTSRPTTVVFTASPDHTALVTSYVVDVYRAADPVNGNPVASRNVGKPTPVGRRCLSRHHHAREPARGRQLLRRRPLGGCGRIHDQHTLADVREVSGAKGGGPLRAPFILVACLVVRCAGSSVWCWCAPWWQAYRSAP